MLSLIFAPMCIWFMLVNILYLSASLAYLLFIPFTLYRQLLQLFYPYKFYIYYITSLIVFFYTLLLAILQLIRPI